MNKFEKLVAEYEDELKIIEIELESCNGYYINNCIFIDINLPINKKYEVLLEEISHYKLNVGKNSVKQEKMARSFAFSKLIKIRDILNYIINNPYSNIELMAEYFDVEVDTLEQLLLCYKSKYGNNYHLDGYIISFVPLKYEIQPKQLFEL